MRRSKSYIQTHDIDWFGIVNNKLMIHVASAGGPIPNRVNNIEQLASNKMRVMQMPPMLGRDDLIINDNAILRLFEDQRSLLLEYRGIEISPEGFDFFREHYLASFIPYAQRGLLTFDKTLYKNEEQDVFHMVCRPRHIDSFSKEFIEGITFFETTDIDNLLSETAQQINLLSILQ